MKRNRRKESIPLRADCFRWSLSRASLAHGMPRPLAVPVPEHDPVARVCVLNRDIPIPGDLIDFDGCLQRLVPEYLQQKLALAGELGIVEIPICEEPMGISCHYEHVSIPGR